MYRFFEAKYRDERGITGLETAIILIAFVVVASVFAFVVLSTGVFSAEREQRQQPALELELLGIAGRRGRLSCIVYELQRKPPGLPYPFSIAQVS